LNLTSDAEYVASLVKAKFHYAIWFLSATSFEPSSVMEFGFKCQYSGCKCATVQFITWVCYIVSQKRIPPNH